MVITQMIQNCNICTSACKFISNITAKREASILLKHKDSLLSSYICLFLEVYEKTNWIINIYLVSRCIFLLLNFITQAIWCNLDACKAWEIPLQENDAQ